MQDVPPAKADTVSLDPQSWYILYSEQMPRHPSSVADGAWSMKIPDAPGSIHYVQTPFRATSVHKKISITFYVSSSSNAVYNGRVDPNAWDPATIHLFLERRGDDLSAEKEYFRWWASEGVYVLGSQDNSVVTIEVPLSSDKWTSVLGHQSEAEFNKTLNDLAWVGITFGGSNFFGHGVNMLSGTSEFTLLDYRVE